ncbi:MAG: HAMP domain-containing histidine kinase [Actinomycetia bacterium]|nr:HAMP domain-containing histidine kinase [Actinomycetes bacterium]
MTRRIALAVMGLVTVLLALTVVPLGLSLAGRERADFREGTEWADNALADAAEERLSDGESADPMGNLLDDAARQGECAAVFDTAGHEVAAAGCGSADAARAAAGGTWPEVARRVAGSGAAVTWKSPGRLTVAVPVGNPVHPVGASVLSRPSDAVDRRIARLWERLAAIGVAGLLAGALLAVLLVRWVGRPLRAVADAARQLGEGQLEARAAAAGGPDEVRRLAATFNTMAMRTETLIHGHRAVIADVSHQLRTPLAALRLRLDLLAVDADHATAAELTAAQEEIARLSRLVDGLLAVARAEHAVPRPVPVRIDEVVRDRLAAWTPVAQERQVSLTAHCPARLTARLGAGDLEQVLDNLVANALDAVPEGALVRIEARAGRGCAVLRVTDDGPGLSPAARAGAFHRFGHPEASGTGLGLAIVHRLVTANGGSVRLEDTPGGGLTVVLELPR